MLGTSPDDSRRIQMRYLHSAQKLRNARDSSQWLVFWSLRIMIKTNPGVHCYTDLSGRDSLAISEQSTVYPTAWPIHALFNRTELYQNKTMSYVDMSRLWLKHWRFYFPFCPMKGITIWVFVLASTVIAWTCDPAKLLEWMASCDNLGSPDEKCNDRSCHKALHYLVEDFYRQCYVDSKMGPDSDLDKYRELDDYCHGETPSPKPNPTPPPVSQPIVSPSTNPRTTEPTPSPSLNFPSTMPTIATTSSPASPGPSDTDVSKTPVPETTSLPPKENVATSLNPENESAPEMVVPAIESVEDANAPTSSEMYVPDSSGALPIFTMSSFSIFVISVVAWVFEDATLVSIGLV